jgi:hypothetical protein
LGLRFEGVFEGGASVVGKVDEGLAAVSGVWAAVDVALLFKSLNGGGNGAAGEADAVAERFDGLGAEVVEDFKEGEIGLRGEADFAEICVVGLAELLV